MSWPRTNGNLIESVLTSIFDDSTQALYDLRLGTYHSFSRELRLKRMTFITAKAGDLHRRVGLWRTQLCSRCTGGRGTPQIGSAACDSLCIASVATVALIRSY